MSLGYAEKLSYREDVGTVGMPEIFETPELVQNKVGSFYSRSIRSGRRPPPRLLPRGRARPSPRRLNSSRPRPISSLRSPRRNPEIRPRSIENHLGSSVIATSSGEASALCSPVSLRPAHSSRGCLGLKKISAKLEKD